MPQRIDKNDEPRDDESRGSFVGGNGVYAVGEFFRGWRRKAGLATLATALLLMAGWMRSYVVTEQMLFFHAHGLQYLESRQGRVAWERFGGLIGFPVEVRWESNADSDGGGVIIEAHEECLIWAWRWSFCGFGCGENWYEEEWRSNYWIIPYWSLLLPLTLLAAWLILAKPRKAKGVP